MMALEVYCVSRNCRVHLLAILLNLSMKSFYEIDYWFINLLFKFMRSAAVILVVASRIYPGSTFSCRPRFELSLVGGENFM